MSGDSTAHRCHMPLVNQDEGEEEKEEGSGRRKKRKRKKEAAVAAGGGLGDRYRVKPGPQGQKLANKLTDISIG